MPRRVPVVMALACAFLAPGAPAAAQSPGPSPSTPPVDRTAADTVVTCPASNLAPAGTGSADTRDFPGATITPGPTSRSVGTWKGTWSPMPASPLAPRAGAATGVLGFAGRLVVWGGRGATGELLADGATFDPATGRWRLLPGTGLAPRERFGFVVDGSGVTIWGGVDADGRSLADGVSLVPSGPDDGMTALALPAAPLTAGPASLAADQTGTFAVTPGATPADPPRFATMAIDDSGQPFWDDDLDGDPATHGGLAPAPVPPGTGYELVPGQGWLRLLSFQADGTAVASTLRDTWPGSWSAPVRVPVPASGPCPAVGASRVGWLGTGLDGTPVGVTASARKPDGAWQMLPAPPAATATSGMLTWGPAQLISADDLLAWDTGAKRRQRLPPLPDGPRTGASAGWIDGRLYLWGGRARVGSVTDTGWVFTPSLPRGVFRLPGGYQAGTGDCGGQGDPARAVLRADRRDRDRVWFTLDGDRYDALWPDGTTVDLRGRVARVRDAQGRVIAREGQHLRDLKLAYCPSGRTVVFE